MPQYSMKIFKWPKKLQKFLFLFDKVIVATSNNMKKVKNQICRACGWHVYTC